MFLAYYWYNCALYAYYLTRFISLFRYTLFPSPSIEHPSKRLFPSSILKKGDLIELIANYPTIFYSHNLTARFLLRPIFALYLTFRRGRQTLMDSYNFVSPTIGIASFFIDLVKFLADERRIKLFTALAATRSSTSSSLLN